jgi:hypothetical protein
MSVLPPELYRTIVENVDYKDLRGLTTVSRVFQIEAECLIHRVVDYGWTDLARFCERLLTLPRFWPFIFHLKIWVTEDRLLSRSD